LFKNVKYISENNLNLNIINNIPMFEWEKEVKMAAKKKSSKKKASSKKKRR
jgi:hypothetical protein